MATKKKYGDIEQYERKLARVMERLNVEQYRYDWNRTDTFVEFSYTQLCAKG